MEIQEEKHLDMILALICSISIFPMTSLYQHMAYWGNGLLWFWVGVSITYVTWLVGIAFLFSAIRKKQTKRKALLKISLFLYLSLN